jgi:hypothetical protein
MQFAGCGGPDYSDHQINVAEISPSTPKTIADDSFHPVPGMRLGNRLFADDQAQTGVLHSIRNGRDA